MRDKPSSYILGILDIDEDTLSKWLKRGCPYTRRSKRLGNLFDPNEVAAWMKTEGLTGKTGVTADPPSQLSDQMKIAKLRKELAMAEKYEIELAQTKELLVKKETVELENASKFSLIRTKLLTLPTTVVPLLLDSDEIKMQATLEKSIREILSELSKL